LRADELKAVEKKDLSNTDDGRTASDSHKKIQNQNFLQKKEGKYLSTNTNWNTTSLHIEIATLGSLSEGSHPTHLPSSRIHHGKEKE
jgi:hypothetical protein